MKRNPAFVFQDKELSFRKKILFMFGEKWFWGLIFLLLLLITFAILVFFALMNNQVSKIAKSRDEWGAEPPRGTIPGLSIPIGIVIVTHTFGDNCATAVKI